MNRSGDRSRTGMLLEIRAGGYYAGLLALKCQATDKPKALILWQDPFALRGPYPTNTITL